jgi:23S rRNA U2552 (ribose-2'-O)-methylase RlmE/FtsJ
MEIPKYIYPKFYHITLVENNISDISNIKLYKNLKLSKELLTVKSYYQQKHQNNYDYEQKYIFKKSSRESSRESKKIQQIIDERDNLFNSIKYFKSIKNIQQKYNIGVGFTNAWKKMYEICQRTHFIPNKEETIKHLDICGLPGGFVLGINHYLKTKRHIKDYDWYLQSYTDKGYLQDDFGLVKKYPNRFLEGDITSKKKIQKYIKFFQKNKRNIVTSDCGLGGEEAYKTPDFEFRDKQMMKIFLGQLITGLGVLEKGGNFFMKSYNSFSPFLISLLYLMSCFFQKVTLIKPILSKQPDGKEIYYCLYNFNGVTDKQISDLLNILENYSLEDLDRNFISYTKMKKDIMDNIEDKLTNYYYLKIKKYYKIEEYLQSLIGFEVDEDPEEYLRSLQKIKKSLFPKFKRFANQYYTKLEYQKIDDRDRLL